jgi:LUD domain
MIPFSSTRVEPSYDGRVKLMIDETDITSETKWFYEERAKVVVNNLQKRNINAHYVANRTEALSALLEMIPEGTKVVRADSVSVDQVGIILALKRRNRNELVDPFERETDGSLVPEVQTHRWKMWREAFSADIFLSGTNAVTLDGKLVNIDATGNRVAPIIFGPEKVILIIGANKIVKDVNEAIDRIHNICAPINARRHALKHHLSELGELPCARTGRCVDCSHEWRICRATVIIEGAYARVKGRIHVVLVGEELGI